MSSVGHTPLRWWVPLFIGAAALLGVIHAPFRETLDDPGCEMARIVSDSRLAGQPIVDPSDDRTSRDPSDNETFDDFAADDGTDEVPVVAWLEDMSRCSITLQSKSAPARLLPASSSSLSRHHVRC
jgi:hypothetical protein